MNISLLFVLLIGAFSVKTRLTEKENEKVIKVKLEDTIEINVRTNPTTGYDWNMKLNNAKLILSSDTTTAVPHEPSMVGFPSDRLFVLKPQEPGTTIIELNYIRPWMPDNAARKLKYTIIIQ
ncbi:Amoebiasin-2 precursor, putative [Entamoeba invadens IP1]|uniref:Amoebiasin-2, putative n=2 Tax=Entamoeba invadens TaxID=33085 RepID=A0A0A1U5E5_ENTIV|nr:Amoebiasin-2 precursor, putative [Entamoeba invadens IP1]ELP89558.1 Amoebiasin-2 precursor, putative [Entamoeba invadens IP1]CAZ44332.1 amoebiasin 2 precursor [Entamoeba invadens]|eukprot:XP_004256329.1 Amoebiasin-2 precursor, putative [Entamoeba invadens IP1]